MKQTRPIRVLFVCIHNSARSQMAEAFLNELGQGGFIAESAGLEPGSLNPVVVQAMNACGIDISGNQTKAVDAFLSRSHEFNYVITVCDEASAERCPVFPGGVNRLHWSFRDPSRFGGTAAEKLAQTITVRDEIRAAIEVFLSQTKAL